MYTTCIYCQGDLGRNEALEEFPVGRRLAFDPARGRLWVVCGRCERWNLSPLETRWEAIEACERRFRDTRLRVSSDNIGLAKLREGLELVRVGDPLRHEFAAWRYGDQFGRRRKRAIVYAGAATAGGGVLVMGGAAAGVSMGALFPPLSQALQNWYRDRTVDRLYDDEGRPIRIQRKHLYTSRLEPGVDEGWRLRMDYAPGWGKPPRRRLRSVEGSGWQLETPDRRGSLIVTGEEAIAFAGKLMAHANRRGGRKSAIEAAVDRIEEAGHPEAFLPLAAREAERSFRDSGKTDLPEKKLERLTKPLPGSLAGLPVDLRLAVEMAAQEEAEREALEGELKGLEAMWRQAEEIAHIADNLLLPEGVEAFVREERERLAGEGDGRERRERAAGEGPAHGSGESPAHGEGATRATPCARRRAGSPRPRAP